MWSRPFGTTDMTVSAVGLGLAALGRPGYLTVGHGEDLAGRTEPAALEHEAHRVLEAARTLGITYVDVARSYGRAEEFLSDWLQARQLERDDVVVGSKWGYVYTADWHVDADVHEVKIHTRANLDRQYGESAALLGGYLRLYQIHSATEQSGVLEPSRHHPSIAVDRGQGPAALRCGPSHLEFVRTIRR